MDVSYHHASPADVSAPPVVADRRTSLRIDRLDVGAYTIPTERPESDGTYEWDSTTIVVVQARAGDVTGLGYSYTQAGAAEVIRGKLASVVCGMDAQHPPAAWVAMVAAVRNYGAAGMVMMAVSAVDTALWDLHARLLDVPVSVALGGVHDAVPVYGSGGFCTYGPSEVAEQLLGWVEAGIPRVKMKLAVTRPTTSTGCALRVQLSAIASSCTWTPTGPSTASRRWSGRSDTRSTTGFAGSRNRSAPTIWRAAAGPGPRTGRAGRGRRRVRLHTLVLRAPARRAGGRLPASRRDPVRRVHRFPQGRRALRCARARPVGAPRPAASRTRLRRRLAPPTPGVLPRPQPDREADVRRMSRPRRWRCLRPDRSRPGLGLELRAADVEGWRVA